MVQTSSTMLPLGSLLPFFDLPLVTITKSESNDFFHIRDRVNVEMLDERPLLLMVLCAHCPFVKHLEAELTQLDKDFGDNIQMFAIGSNSLETHPEDGPENLAKQIIKNDWRFPYLLDQEQTFAKSLRAACTPDFFLFSSNDKGKKQLVYRGQFDASRPGNDISPSGSDLRRAFDDLLNCRSVFIDQKPSIGCNIKWIPGEEPLWFG